jgi:predicted anti-sigma-YlaC factor YlaD
VTGHLTEDQFQKYTNRKFPTSELLSIGDHLAECKQCRARVDKTEERAAILQALTRDLQ